MMDGRDKLDRFLDRALNEHSQVSPRPGLDQRILAKVDAQSSKQRAFAWQWIAVPALALLAICAIIIGPWSRHENKSNVAVIHHPGGSRRETTQKTPTAVIANLERPRSHQQRPHRLPLVSQPSEPRLATFPSSSGDDELVRLAVSFAQTHPAVANQITQEQKEFRQLAQTFTAPLVQSNEQ